jgi:hypothetical protein
MSAVTANQTAFSYNAAVLNSAKAILLNFEREYIPPQYPFAPPSVMSVISGSPADYSAPEVSTLGLYKRTTLLSGFNDFLSCSYFAESGTMFASSGHSSSFQSWCRTQRIQPTQLANAFQVRVGSSSDCAEECFSLPINRVITVKALVSDFLGLPVGRVWLLAQKGRPLQIPAPRARPETQDSRVTDRDVRNDVLNAVKFTADLLSASERNVAKALKISPSSIGHWKAGRKPRPSRASRALALRALLAAILSHLGDSQGRAWLELGSPLSRRELILRGDLREVEADAAEFLFPLGARPRGGYSPYADTIDGSLSGRAVKITERRPVKVDASSRDR